MDPSIGVTTPQVTTHSHLEVEEQSNPTSVYQDLIKDLPDHDKVQLLTCILDKLPDETLMSVLNGIFENQLHRRDAMLPQYMPTDCLEYLIQATSSMYSKGADNIIYVLLKGLASPDVNRILPFDSLPFSIIQLIIVSLFGDGAESFHQMPSSTKVIQWLQTSCELMHGPTFLDQVNKILFPSESMKYKVEKFNNESKIVLEMSEMDTQTDGSPLKTEVPAEEKKSKLESNVDEGAKEISIHDVIDEDGDFMAPESDQEGDTSIPALMKIENLQPETPLPPQGEIKNLDLVQIKSENLEDALLSQSRLKFDCGLCVASFLNKKQLRQHEVTKHCLQEDGSYKCLKCDRSFSTVLSLAKHDKAHQRANVYKCQWANCKKRFPTKADLQLHIENHSKIICDVCGVSFKHKSSLKQHIKTFHSTTPTPTKEDGPKDWVCKLCNNKEFTSRFQYRIHMAHTHPDSVEKNFKCDECGKKFTCKRNLKTHLAGIHNIGEKKFKCTLCLKSFHYENLLRKHVAKWHEGITFEELQDITLPEELMQPPEIIEEQEEAKSGENDATSTTTGNTFQCEKCNKFFRHAVSLRHHKKFVHGSEGPLVSLKCNICEKLFNSKVAYIRHKALVHGVKREHKCETCVQTFPTRKDLVDHLRDVHDTHLPLSRSFACQSCNKQFGSVSALSKHERAVHQGIKEFKCTTCPAGFSSKVALERHTKMHLGIKDFKCSKCNMMYYTEKHLQRHERHVHGGGIGIKKAVTKHHCDQCEKSFVEKRYLIRHQQREHLGRKEYDEQICSLCGVSFSGKSSLNRHHRRIHQGLKDHTSRDFQCELCAKTFVFKQSLQRHMQSAHKQELPPHQCEICNKRFASAYNLRKHQENHMKSDDPYNALKLKKQKKFPKTVKVMLPQDMDLSAAAGVIKSDETVYEGDHQIVEIHVTDIQPHQQQQLPQLQQQQLTLHQPQQQQQQWQQQQQQQEQQAYSVQGSAPTQFLLQEQVTDTIRPIHMQPDGTTLVEGQEVVLQAPNQQLLGWAAASQEAQTHLQQQAQQVQVHAQAQTQQVQEQVQEINLGSGAGVDVVEIPSGVRFIKVGHQIIKVDGTV